MTLLFHLSSLYCVFLIKHLFLTVELSKLFGFKYYLLLLMFSVNGRFSGGSRVLLPMSISARLLLSKAGSLRNL